MYVVQQALQTLAVVVKRGWIPDEEKENFPGPAQQGIFHQISQLLASEPQYVRSEWFNNLAGSDFVVIVAIHCGIIMPSTGFGVFIFIEIYTTRGAMGLPCAFYANI